MKKLITAFVLASTALAAPVAADQATIAPDADVDGFYLDDFIIGVVHDEDLLATYCSDDSFDALAHFWMPEVNDEVAMLLDGGYIGDYALSSLGDQGDALQIKELFEKEEWLVVGLYGPDDDAPSFFLEIERVREGLSPSKFDEKLIEVTVYPNGC